jgi:hypothetical protein
MDYMPIVTQFLNNFLPPLAGVLGTFLAILALQWIRLLQAKIKAENPALFEQLEWLAALAVKAAEQAGAAGFIYDKKAYAIKFIQDWLAKYNLGDVDVSAIEAAIEAAVFEQFKGTEIKMGRRVPPKN